MKRSFCILLLIIATIITSTGQVFAINNLESDNEEHYMELRAASKIATDDQLVEGEMSRDRNIPNILKINQVQNKSNRAILNECNIFESEPNNYFHQANEIDLGCYIHGTITDYYFDIDIFQIKIKETGTLEIYGMFGNNGEYSEYLAIGVYDENENLVDICYHIYGYDYNLQEGLINLDPGIYYIVVFQNSDYEYILTNESYIFITDFIVLKGWVESRGNWYFYNDTGNMIKNEWLKNKGKWYYLDSSGIMQTGWLKSGGKWYYLSSSGAMQTGWTKVGGKWYYMNSSGVMQTGWQKLGGKWYYLSSSGAMETGWIKVGSKWYYMNSSGVMLTSWQKINGKWYYLATNGAMETGWTKVGSKWYYMNSSGVMQTGWIKLGGNWYFLDSNGAMETGWSSLRAPSKNYNMKNPAGLGVKQKIKVENYLGDYTMEMTVKEVIRGGEAWSRIYAENMFNTKPESDEEYILAKIKVKLLEIEGGKSIDISPIHFDLFSSKNAKYDYLTVVEPKPSIRTTLYKNGEHEGHIAFLVNKSDNNPKFVYGTKYDGTGGIWFNFKKSNNEWTKGDGKWYYFGTSGTMQTGWVKVSGKWYYMDKNGVMLSNTTVDGYKLGKDGAML